MNSDPEPLPQIGWKERLDFPDWGLSRLRAKIDTGAHTSALHVARYELHPSEVSLWLEVDPHQAEPLELRLPVIRVATVRGSMGMRERRPVIGANVRLGTVVLPVEFTLTNRARMRHRIILGRQALAGRFIVDPGRVNLLSRRRRRKRS